MLGAFLLFQACRLSGQSLWMLQHGPAAFAEPFGSKYAQEWIWVWLHAVPACLVLVLGPLLIWRDLLGFNTSRWHARAGRVYLICAGLAGLAGIPLSLRAEGGFWGQLGFLCLTGWFGWAGWRAYRAARSRRWREHRDWVCFHYALACSAVFLRLGLGLSSALNWNPPALAAALAWLSWQPALLYAILGPLQLLAGKPRST